MKRSRRKFNPSFKAMVAIVGLKDRETLAELAQRFELYPIKSLIGNLSFLKNPVLSSIGTAGRRRVKN